MERRPADQAAAYELLERVRWGGRPTRCPLCGASGSSYFLQPAAETGRRTRTGAVTGRRLWKCSNCRRQFSVLAGTILQGTRISPRTWIAVVAERERGPLSSGDVVARYGVGAEAARRMLRRLDLAADFVAKGEAALPALLQIPAAAVQQILALTPTRTRPRPQAGPSADYGRPER